MSLFLERFNTANPALVPYGQVAEVFSDFDKSKYTNRGGSPRNKCPYITPGDVNAQLVPDYHVQSSFTDLQLPFATRAHVYLRDFMVGRTFGEQADTPPVFSQRIADNFMHQFANQPLSFVKAMVDATSQNVEDFLRHYPNLGPALEVCFNLAGTLGSAQSIIDSSVFLEDSLKGTLNPDTSKDYQGALKGFIRGHEKFVQSHPKKAAVRTHENWCLGENVGNEMIKQAKRAALILSSNSWVAQKYDPRKDLVFNLSDGLSEEGVIKVTGPLGKKLRGVFQDFRERMAALA